MQKAKDRHLPQHVEELGPRMKLLSTLLEKLLAEPEM